MREFRAYTLSATGKIFSREDLTCADEEDAKQAAAKLVDGHAVELWEGARLIVRFDAKPI